MNVCAIIAVRNEARHLPILLEYLARSNVDVVIVDNESSDESVDIASSRIGNSVIAVHTLPFHGQFSLSDQLRLKAKLVSDLDHEWIIHQDADEILEHREPGESLLEIFREAERQDCTTVNFDEFVFVPPAEEREASPDFLKHMRHYYFFEPDQRRLMRAWRRDTALSNVHSGGHVLQGTGGRLVDVNHNLRHYMALSQGHVEQKYLARKYSEEDLARGWHGNRVSITRDNLRLPTTQSLLTLPCATSKSFRRDTPRRTHFWEWL